MGNFWRFLVFGLNYLEYIWTPHLERFWSIWPTIRAKIGAEVVENRLKMVSADTVFATYLGHWGHNLGPSGPKLAHLGPKLWPIVVLVKKDIWNIKIRHFLCIFGKTGQKTFIRDYFHCLFPGLTFTVFLSTFTVFKIFTIWFLQNARKRFV